MSRSREKQSDIVKFLTVIQERDVNPSPSRNLRKELAETNWTSLSYKEEVTTVKKWQTVPWRKGLSFSWTRRPRITGT